MYSLDAVKEMKNVLYHKRKAFLNILYIKLTSFIFEESEGKKKFDSVKCFWEEEIDNESFIKNGECLIYKEKRLLSYVVQLNGLLECDDYIFYNLKYNYYTKIKNFITKGFSLHNFF